MNRLTAVLLVTTTFTTFACTPRFVEPMNSEPRAILNLPSGIAHIFRSSHDCSDRAVMHARTPDQNSFFIPAEREITVGTITDGTGSGVSFVVIGSSVMPIIDGSGMDMCRIIFTFTPQDGQVYRVSNALRSDKCQYTVVDSSGSEVAVRVRSPVGRAMTDRSAWCNSAP